MDGADILLPIVETEAVLGGKAYDAQERVIGPLTQRGIEVVIPPKKTARELCNYDEILYKADTSNPAIPCKSLENRS